MSERPREEQPAAPPPPRGGDEYTADEEAEVQKRLEDLGYVE